MKDETPTDLEADSEGGFLSRWSRRKQQLDQIEETPPPALDAEAVEIDPVPEPVLTDADMPPVDSLDEGSDYSGFLSPGVSDELRRLALRKLFRAASYNITDGLDDYDEDFTSFAKLGDIVTREMRVRNAIDAAREKAKELLASLESPADSTGAEVPAALTDETSDDAAETVVSEETPAQDVPSIAAQDDTDNTLDEHPEEAPHEQQSQPA